MFTLKHNLQNHFVQVRKCAPLRKSEIVRMSYSRTSEVSRRLYLKVGPCIFRKVYISVPYGLQDSPQSVRLVQVHHLRKDLLGCLSSRRTHDRRAREVRETGGMPIMSREVPDGDCPDEAHERTQSGLEDVLARGMRGFEVQVCQSKEKMRCWGF